MLREVIDVRLESATHRKHWFTDECFDLFVWLDKQNQITSYQLAYEKNTDREHIITWQRGTGYKHNKVDSGDKPGKYKESPILVPDGTCDTDIIAERFRKASAELPQTIADFVEQSIRHYKE